MKEVTYDEIAAAVERLCIRSTTVLPPDLAIILECACDAEPSEAGKNALYDIYKNFQVAAREGLPICQDTGMAVVFAEVGQDMHIKGGSFEEAVCEGVRRGYINGGLRKSVVKDPFRRVNTGDNTPPVIHTRIVPGNTLKLTVAPKGFGSENCSAAKMFLPSDGQDSVEAFIVETVSNAGSKACPPMVVGIGLGGTIEKAALLAKTALTRPADARNADPFYAEMEARILTAINRLGIGPQGFGGKYTAVAVNIEVFPTHIAGLPCVVNIGCHVTRHASTVL